MANGFNGASAQDLVAKHGGSAADWNAIASHLGFGRGGWSEQQVDQIKALRNEAKASGVSVKQFLQSVPGSCSRGRFEGPADISQEACSALVQEVVAPAVHEVGALLTDLSVGLTQIAEQGSDAAAQMVAGVAPMTLVMAAEKGARGQTSQVGEMLRGGMQDAFASFRTPRGFRTALNAAMPTGPVVGALSAGTDSGSEADSNA